VKSKKRLKEFVSNIDWSSSGHSEPVNTGALSEEECYQTYRAVIEDVGEFDTSDNHMNILGVRGFQGGDMVENVPNEYNDSIIVLWRDSDGSHCREYKASVDPGKNYTETSFFPEKGCAHLIDGQYLYKIGLHKGEYEALVQAGDVLIWRDYDKDYEYNDEELVEEGYFGINIHAGGLSDAVDAFSAGCQVIHGGREGKAWMEFVELAKSHPTDTIR
jgi:hypothetical protein